MQKGVVMRSNYNGRFTAIAPGAIIPGYMPDFRIYVFANGRHILWANNGNTVTPDQLKKLMESGAEEVYIDIEDGFVYDQYLENRMGDILTREEPSGRQKAEIFARVTNKVIKQTFASTHESSVVQQESIDRIEAVVANALSFIAESRSIEALSKMVGHDYNTYEHATKVLWLTVMFLNENQDVLEQIEPGYTEYSNMEKKRLLERCGVAAMLHDIGKVLVPPGILNKNGPLNETEWEIIKSHTLGGLAMLLDTDIPVFVKKAVVQHHEDFNGGGYPMKIEGNSIHPLARIVRIMDVFDAMTSRRSYKDAMSPIEVAKIMAGDGQDRDSGMKRCFDERYLRKFIILLGKLPAMTLANRGKSGIPSGAELKAYAA